MECSCGITRGNIVLGTISVSDTIINFDIFGDTVNTAARIARNNARGVFFKARDFHSEKKFDPE